MTFGELQGANIWLHLFTIDPQMFSWIWRVQRVKQDNEGEKKRNPELKERNVRLGS